MTTLIINNTPGLFGTPEHNVYLTTDHAASSYGVPVLIKRGVAHGPADLIDLANGRAVPAAAYVVAELDTFRPTSKPLSAEESALVQKFCQYLEASK